MIKFPKLWLPETRVQRYKHQRSRRGSWWWCCCQEDIPPPPGCIYFTDDFTGSDGASLDLTKWDVLLGSWTINSNVARTTDSTAYIRAKSSSGSLGGSSVVKVRSSGFNQAYIYSRASFVANGVHFGTGAVVDFAQNKIKIVSPDPAIPSITNIIAECEFAFSLNTFYTIRVCHHRLVDKAQGNEVFRGIITVFIDGDPIIRAYDPNCAGWQLVPDEDPVTFILALGTGGVDFGTYVEFDDAVATRLDPDGDPLCHECAKCCWPYLEDPPDTITAEIIGLGGDANPCFFSGNLCQILEGSTFQMTKTPYPYVEDIHDFNALIYFPCAYYTLGGLNFVCDSDVFNRVSLVVGTGRGCPGLDGAFLSSCIVEWRLWQDNGDTFYRSRAFVDFVKSVSYELPPFQNLGALCGGFPLDLSVGATGIAACNQFDAILRLTTP